MYDGQYLDGAYRLHRQDDVKRLTALAVNAFPKFAGRITCFGTDWLGRQFATDQGRVVGGQAQVLVLEPGTGEALEIPLGMSAFHEEELVEFADAAVAETFYREWLGVGGRPPAYDQCVAYKVPLYLGGADDISNLQMSDFEVYWTISAQLLAKVRNLPLDTPVSGVSMIQRDVR